MKEGDDFPISNLLAKICGLAKIAKRIYRLSTSNQCLTVVAELFVPIDR